MDLASPDPPALVQIQASATPGGCQPAADCQSAHLRRLTTAAQLNRLFRSAGRGKSAAPGSMRGVRRGLSLSLTLLLYPLGRISALPSLDRKKVVCFDFWTACYGPSDLHYLSELLLEATHVGFASNGDAQEMIHGREGPPNRDAALHHCRNHGSHVSLHVDHHEVRVRLDEADFLRVEPAA